MEDQTGNSKPKLAEDDNDKGDQAQAQVPIKSVEQNSTPLTEELADDESKKSPKAVIPIEIEDNNQQQDQIKESKSEVKEAQSIIENINQKDLEPIHTTSGPSKKSNEDEAKNTASTTTTMLSKSSYLESTNSRRSERFKKATQRFATNELRTPKVAPRSTSKKLSIIVNGNDIKPNQTESLSTNSSGTQVVEEESKSNLVVESMTELKPSLMVEKSRLSFAREKNIKENDTKDVIVKRRGRVPITEGKRVDELFIMKKTEEYQRDGTWRDDAIKIKDKIKMKTLYQCKTCKKSIDSMWKLYHHRQVHLEMNYYLCQFCLVGFNIPISRQLHENTCSRRTNGASVMKNMLMMYRNQFKEKSQRPSLNDEKAPKLDPLEMGEIKPIPKLKKSKPIIRKSKSAPVKRAVKKKAIARTNSGSDLSSEYKTEDGVEIFSHRKKRIRTKHIIREGEPEFDSSTYDWTKYSNRVKIPGKPGYKYFCLTCKKLQSSKENLFYHMLIHTNEWPFGCNYCERVFRVPSNRDKHENLSCLNRQSLSMGLSDIKSLNGDAPILKKMKIEPS